LQIIYLFYFKNPSLRKPDIQYV